MKVTVYQTIEKREGQSVEEILKEGPFECIHHSAWLGDGHYFWDTYEELAHAWGEKAVKGPYAVCQAEIEVDDRCFDLLGNLRHKREFKETLQWMVKNNPQSKNNFTVRQVLLALEKRIGLREQFEAIRLDDVFSFYNLPTVFKNLPTKLKIRHGDKWKIDLKDPQIQICLYKKDALDFKEYKVIHPDPFE